MSGSILLYVQHLLGVGHLRRAETIARAAQHAGLKVTVATGGRPVPQVDFAGIDMAQLPPAAISGEDFSTLVDADGRPVDTTWRARRAEALAALWRRVDPDVLLLEMFPFGRRQFRFELLPLLEAAHAAAHRPLVACSVRDVLVGGRKPGRDAETAQTLRRFFDAVLVHGDPRLIRLDETFPETDAIADLVRYTGYVTGEPPAGDPGSAGSGEVIVSAGGGAVGAPLLSAALAARPLTSVAGRTWRILTGPQLPQGDFDRLAALAGADTVVERFRPDFPQLLARAALSISQAGYNTTMDILRAGTRAVVVPYETGGETEQRRRSDLLAKRGLLAVVPASDLSPQRLAAAIDGAMAGSPAATGSVDMAGASKSAALLAELAGRRSGRRNSPG